MHSLRAFLCAALVAAPLLSGGAAPADRPSPVFRAVFHEAGGDAWLLTEDGSALYSQTGAALPGIAAPLVDGNGKLFDWGKRPPTAFTRWQGEWLFVDGSRTLARFDAGGTFARHASLPMTATVIVASPERLWIFNGLPSGGPTRIWSSTDGKTFAPHEVKLMDESSPRDKVLGTQMVFAARSDELWLGHMIGAPRVSRLLGDSMQSWGTAFSRTRSRDRLVRYDPAVDDLSTYSSPVGEIHARSNGELLVLRNREDVRDGSSGSKPVLRLHVDRYSPRMRLQATARFAEPIRTILGSTAGSVRALALSGHVIEARWGKPDPGGLIP